ncbi:MAG: MliC family protein [Patescibacteria group bacterium]
MKTRHLYFLSAVTLVLVVAAGMFVYAISRTASVSPIPSEPVTTSTQAETAFPTSTSPVIANANYSCDGSKTISAVYSSGTVQLTLSDGRQLTMPQTVSGSGIRYEQGQGTPQDIIFWSEGPNAFLSENGTNTYEDCVAGTTTAHASGSKTFTDQGQTFSFTYPSNLTVSGGGVGYTSDWSYNFATTTGLLLAEVDLPSSMQPNTNLVDAKLTVGTSADTEAIATCLTQPSGYQQTPSSAPVTVNGVTFTKFISGDNGAGNIYDITSYRTLRNSQCYAVEYVIHSGNIGNYDPSAGISMFDEQAIQNTMEGIVQSFTFLGPDQAVSASVSPTSPTSTDEAATGTATVTVTMQSSGTAIHLKKGQSFLLNLGNLKWTLSFDPADSMSKIPDSPESNGFQGAYEADAVGTTTLHGIGAPICNPGQACPMFLVNFTATIVVN